MRTRSLRRGEELFIENSIQRYAGVSASNIDEQSTGINEYPNVSSGVFPCNSKLNFPGFDGRLRVGVRTGGKSMGHEWKSQHVRLKCMFIKAHRQESDTAMMCRLFDVSRSGFY